MIIYISLRYKGLYTSQGDMNNLIKNISLKKGVFLNYQFSKKYSTIICSLHETVTPLNPLVSRIQILKKLHIRIQ